MRVVLTCLSLSHWPSNACKQTVNQAGVHVVPGTGNATNFPFVVEAPKRILAVYGKSDHEIHKRGTVDLQISIRKCGDVTVLDLRGRSITNDCERGPLTKHLRDLADQGKR